jgi:hypothetical protein
MGTIQELSTAARRWWQVQRSGTAPKPDHDAFRSGFAKLSGSAAVEHISICEVPSDQPPWFDTNIDLAPGEEVSLFAIGRTILSKPLDVWVGPQFQLWTRIGENGDVFNGTRTSNSFSAETGGRLFLSSYFPGQWADRKGRLATELSQYAGLSGGLTVAVIRWKDSAAGGLNSLHSEAEQIGESALADEILAESVREADPPSEPGGWSYLWFLGRSDIFARAEDEIRCHTRENVGILQTEIPCALTPDTRIAWDWKVDALPSTMAENAVLSHDYLSLAVEFNDGRDITYYWSCELDVGTGYWCPLPTWKDREFHVVIRSGERNLGAWLSEERNLYEDYEHYIGVPPSRIVRVWLIANSLFQRKDGICSYRRIRLTDGDREKILL